MGETLVIHPGALGDLLLAIPALRALKRRAPDPLVLAAQPRIGALLAALGAIDGHVGFDGLGLEALFVDEGTPPDLPALARAARVVCWFGARDPIFVQRLAEAAPGAVVAPPSGGPGVAVWEHLLATVSAGGEDLCEPVTPSPDLLAAGRRALDAVGWDGRAQVLIVHPGAGGMAKRWPAEGFARAIDELRATPPLCVIVNVGPADRAAVDAFLSHAAGPIGILPEQPLPHLAGALHLASAYVGNDSGVSHLAAAVGAPSLILFTREGLPWRPWSFTARPLVVSMGGVDASDLGAVVAGLRALLDWPPSDS